MSTSKPTASLSSAVDAGSSQRPSATPQNPEAARSQHQAQPISARRKYKPVVEECFYSFVQIVMVLLGVLLIVRSDHVRQPAMLYLWSGLLLFMYLSVVCMAPFRQTGKVLRLTKNYEQTEEYLASLAEIDPVVKTCCECFHQGSHSTYDGSKTTISYYHAVTHRASSQLQIEQCIDETEPLTVHPRDKPTKLYVDLSVVFHDESTRAEFQRLKDDLRRENEHRDTSFGQWEEFTLPTLENEFVVLSSSERVRWYFSLPAFMVCNALLLQVPYVILLQYACYTAEHTVKKVVSTSKIGEV